MHRAFNLTLLLNHACNLRCAYCYTGEKFRCPMPTAIGKVAIQRAIRSLSPGGSLELCFFGGEPLLEAELADELLDHALRLATDSGARVVPQVTTNGTLRKRAAWRFLTRPDLRVSVSHDLGLGGQPLRPFVDGSDSTPLVRDTITRLLDAGKEIRVISVVRPGNLHDVASGLCELYELGVRNFDLSLDLWTVWSRADVDRLETLVGECADFWADRLPECSVSWFDEAIAKLAELPTNETGRCGFGSSQVAVTPAGRLYPCERVIGADLEDNPLRLAGNATEGNDFLSLGSRPTKTVDECRGCALDPLCGTSCACSNYVRTGDVGRPDRLLCRFEQSRFREAARALRGRQTLSSIETSERRG